MKFWTQHLMNKFDKILKHVFDFQLFISMAALVAVIGINAFEILFRFLIGRSLVWVQDITVLLMAWAIFSGFTKVVYDKRNIVITLLTDLFSEKAKIILKILTNILILIFYLILSKFSYQLFVRQFGTFSPIIRIPSSFCTFAVLINCLLISLIYANEIYKNIIKKQKKLIKRIER